MRSLRILPLIPLLLLAGCFLVEDFGKYWDKGIVDPLLEGTWTDIISRDSVTLVKRGDHYGYADLKDSTQLKTLKAGENTYLMLKGAAKEHALLRYAATADRLVVYAPNPAKRDDFLKNYAAGSKNFSVTPKGVKIGILNESTVKLLELLAKDKDYWEEKAILEKNAGLTDKVIDQEKAAEKKIPEEKKEKPAEPNPLTAIHEQYKDVLEKKQLLDTTPEVKPNERYLEYLKEHMIKYEPLKEEDITPPEVTPAPPPSAPAKGN